MSKNLSMTMQQKINRKNKTHHSLKISRNLIKTIISVLKKKKKKKKKIKEV